LSHLDSAKARPRARICLCGLLIAFTYTGCTTLFSTPPDPSVSSTAASTSTVPAACPQPRIVDAHSLAKTNNGKAMQSLKRQPHDRKRRIVDGLKSSEAGIVIVRVIPGSVAEESGVREGDIVMEVNGQAVTSAKAFEQIADKVPKDQAVLLLLKRKGTTMYLTLRP
jgi:type II secretory pathway component PulC